MQGNLGNVIADYGFNFFEKIHEPIFLIDRQGHVKRLNEAARKFLKVTKINISELEKFSCLQMQMLFPNSIGGFKRTYLGTRRRTLIARSFENTNLLLIELRK